MATRLNADIRTQIMRNAIDGQFDPKFAALDKAERELSLRIYHELVPLKHRRVLDEMRDIKSPYVPLHHPKDIRLLPCSTGSGYYINLVVPDDVVVPAGYGRFKLTGDMGAAAEKAAHAREDLKHAKVTAWKALLTAINKVTTLEKLLEQWPEGKKYYTSPPLKQPVTLPAIRFTEINQMLGLS